MSEKDLRIVFFGTPIHAVYVLEELEKMGILPALVVTAPDKPAGRKLQLSSPPVKDWALEREIEILQPNSLKDDVSLEALYNSEWDVAIVAAYNTLLPTALLSLPKHGVLNVHPSLLPKNRGPSPVRSAILIDDKSAVGVSIISLDAEMDHGPLVAQATVELDDWPVRGRVLDELLFREGGRLMGEALPEWVKGTIEPLEQQHEQATYTKKIQKADGELLDTDDEYVKYCKFCAYDGWPGTYFFTNQHGTRVRIKVTDATYQDGKFVIKKVIPEGKREMDYSTWYEQRNKQC